MKGILLSGAIAAVFAFFGTPALIKILAKKGYGQIIREDGPTINPITNKADVVGVTPVIK